ncbi:MAG: CsbD family protein [Candidatus Omnitrophica bacterium]|nr:CsbD family protein [Candidatus Omnitrophota bacterium]
MDGQVDKMKGRVKQAAGDLTNNKRLKDEGKADEFRGTVKNKIDKAAKELKKQV